MVDGCADNAQVRIHTAFTAAECGAFATRYNALTALSPATPYSTPVFCTGSDCNMVGATAVESAAPRGAAVGAAAVALALAAAAL
jgi:hypothetical protein